MSSPGVRMLKVRSMSMLGLERSLGVHGGMLRSFIKSLLIVVCALIVPWSEVMVSRDQST